jgi:S-adenosylmethionine/arginine decarboxylase-like enzyme
LEQPDDYNPKVLFAERQCSPKVAVITAVVEKKVDERLVKASRSATATMVTATRHQFKPHGIPHA